MRKVLLFIFLFTAMFSALKAEEGKWINLFDGKTLNGWRVLGGKATFRVEKGVIVGTTSTGGENYNTFLCTEKEYGNFNLEFDFLVDEGLNSGVQFRGLFSDGLVRGYQFEIDPDKTTKYTARPFNQDVKGQIIPSGKEPRSWTGGVYDEKRRGWLNDLTENPEARAAFRPNSWNKGRIEAHKDGIRTYINGVLASSLVDYMTPNGFIGLQVHWLKDYKKMEVRFRNIRIQDLGLNPVGTGETLDRFIGEWKDDRTNYLAQSYIDKTTKEYKLNISKIPYANAEPFVVLTGTVSENHITYSNEQGYIATMEKGVLKVKGEGLEFSGRLVVRKSPTLNMPAPEDAEILFDGNDVKAWGGLAKKEWLKWSFDADQSVELTPAGNIRMIPGKQSIITKKDYGDIKHLHLEFRLLGEVTNGGVYMQSRYEFNIKDSWGQGKGAPCGTFGNLVNSKEPEFNYALPPMVWQTMDIQYKAARFNDQGEKIANARVSMSMNGMPIYEDYELDLIKGAAGGRTPLGPLGPIYLQEHGTAYEFRNIWVVE